MPAADQVGKIFALLRLRSVLGKLVDAEVGVRAIRQADGCGRAGNLFHGDDVREIAEVGAAVFFVDRDTQQPEVAELGPYFAGRVVLAIYLRGDGSDFVLGKTAHGLPKERDRLAQIKVQPFNTLLLELSDCGWT